MSDREAIARALAAKCDYYLTDERLAVLISDTTCDIEACPGSGKTTTLALKAALELECLGNRYGALAILSHTNVARGEIERKTIAIPEARSILMAPHFVGTIQTFVNRFLALPFLRSIGMDVFRIDNESTGAFQARLLGADRFSTARYALDKRSDWDVAGLEIDIDEGALTFNGDPIPISRDKPSYKQLVQLKREAMDKGFFRFGDMYSFAHRYMNACSWVVPMLRKRFTIVLIDEAQDNDDQQSSLLRALFPRRGSQTRVHRFGDSNQAIFGDTFRVASGTDFPEEPVLPISESMRFGSFIADVVSSVSANGQTVLGAGENASQPHSVFLYDDAAIDRVVPAFADLVASMLRPEESVVAFAIGARRSVPAPASDGALRAYLGAYFPTGGIEGDGEASEDCFVTRVAGARADVPAEFAAAARSVLQGCARLVKLYPVKDYAAAFRRLREDPLRRRTLGSIVLRLLRMDVVNENLWKSEIRDLLALLRPLYGEPSAAAESFLAFRKVAGLASLGGNASEFVLDAVDRRRVAVQVKTIHAAKGETHRATLVLECFNRTHDLMKLAPYLCGTKRITGKEQPADRQRLKMVYVALSRPKHLVCLALNAKHLTADEVSILAQRWNVVRLSAGD